MEKLVEFLMETNTQDESAPVITPLKVMDNMVKNINQKEFSLQKACQSLYKSISLLTLGIKLLRRKYYLIKIPEGNTINHRGTAAFWINTGPYICNF